jgi:predicted ATP-grasp superfamily ATP-dependent carboligase
MVDALVLDARLRQSLVAVRSLGRSGLTVAAAAAQPTATVPAFRSRWCASGLALTDPGSEAAFVQALCRLLEQHPARVVLVSHDGAIAAIQRHREQVQRRACVALAAPEATAQAVNKAATLALADRLGIPTPRGVPVDGADPSEAARTVAAEVGFPAVVKPLESWMQANGVATRQSCEDVVDRTEAERAIDRVWRAGGQVVVQEWLPGDREAVSLVRDGDRVVAAFAQVAHRMHPPIGGSSVLRESIPLPDDATPMARRLLEAMGLDGYAEVEFRRDRQGRPVLMEVNPRLSASVEVAVRAGVDFPLLLYRWALGDAPASVDGYRHGVRMRWLGGDMKWLARNVLRDPTRARPDVVAPARAMATFLRDSLRPAAYDYLDRDDPWPAILQGALLPWNAWRVMATHLRAARRPWTSPHETAGRAA